MIDYSCAAVRHARNAAGRSGYNVVLPEHLLLGLIRYESEALKILRDFGVPIEDLDHVVSALVGIADNESASNFPLDEAAEKLLRESVVEGQVSEGKLLLALALHQPIDRVLSYFGVRPAEIEHELAAFGQ